MTASRSISAIVLVASLAIVSCGGGGTPAALTSPSVAPTASPTWTPTRDIELVVQAAAGGGSDLFARKIAALLTSEKAVTRPINVVNKPGGSGAVAYAYVQQKKADPHTLATITLSYLTTPLEQSTGFTYKDFSNLVTLAVDDFVAVVKAEASYQSLGDLVKAAKAAMRQIKVIMDDMKKQIDKEVDRVRDGMEKTVDKLDMERKAIEKAMRTQLYSTSGRR